MTAVLDRFDAEHLATVSPARRASHLAILSDLEDWLAPMPLDAPGADAIARFLADRVRAGYGPGTVRKWRAMLLGFYGWMWRQGNISGDTLLELRAIRPPTGSEARARPHPYRPGELRELRRVLDERWPRLPDEEAKRWVERWREGRSPYSRIRLHAIRVRLDAVIALALHCGLRRDEIFRLDVEALHPDNAYIVVWNADGPWRGKHRIVPYTDSACAAIEPWVRLHNKIKPDHLHAWLNLSSATTVREPMKRHTFDRLLRRYIGEGWALRRLRTTCIVNRIRAGMALEHLSEVLGYSDVAELLPYARCVGGNPAREMDRRDARFSESIGVARATA